MQSNNNGKNRSSVEIDCKLIKQPLKLIQPLMHRSALQ